MGVDSEDSKALFIFGRDVSQIPCFRSSFLYGISGGLGCGLLYFLLSSRVKAATDVAFASFGVITMSYWVYCRYNYSKAKFEMEKVQELLRRRTLYEGTEQDPEKRPVDV